MRLKELRIAKGLYQKDVADFLGVDRTTYTKYESGASEPDIATLTKLADYFCVTVDYLINYERQFHNMENEEIGREEKKAISTVGNRIMSNREKKGYSLDQMADKLNISVIRLFSYERDLVLPSHKEVKEIAKILGVNADSIFGEWSSDVSIDFDKAPRIYPEIWTETESMEQFKINGVPYSRQNSYMTIKRKLSNGELTSDYDNFIFSTVTDEFGEYSTSLLKLFLKVEGNDQSAVLNMLSNYLKLSVRSQGKIDGQIEELLKTEQYSAQEGLKNA